MRSFSPFFFLLIILSSTVFFAEIYAEETDEEQCKYQYELTLEHPNSLTFSCLYKLDCQGLESTYKEGKSVLEEDYLTQLFLQNNPWGSINIGTVVGQFQTGNAWLIGDKSYHGGKNMAIGMNMCNDITLYNYQDLNLRIREKGDNGKATLDIENNNISNSSMLVGEGKYEIATRILGHHTSPKVQMIEFSISPNEIQCNEGLELYKRNNNNAPLCLKPQTYEKLLERGFEMSQY